jgi:drug/metabolite transporter (DMT)-like permease
MTYVIATLCVVGIAAGQVLFKLAAVSWNRSGSFLEPGTLGILASALLLYGATTLAWVWVLQKIDLGRAYPLMALSFVLVPVGSYFAFGERFPPQYSIGIALIVVGIVVAMKA